jgi:DNA-binding NarL/FixJ family response regulator
LSNTEIAERLYVSKKTVEHHVSAIFSRLGVTTRARAIHMASSLEGSSRTK